ncbi:AraC family transcriptional regulator [Paenibacillus daejeonensis]|uniref:AraC family transcriptional regulator n=1 Tax=Paenibacillus daejeonensis TaxID=135193 RepID=UPI0003814A12|nr:AraC family transcriptional regulator [Paenibacillus daejeonensis]
MKTGTETVLPYDRVATTTAGSIVYPPGGAFGPRIQQDVQLVLLHTGAMTVTIDQTSHTVQPGHAVILLPGHQEQFHFADKQETWHRWVAIHLDAPEPELLDLLGGLPFCVPLTEELNRLTDLVLALRTKHAESSAIMRSMGHAAIQLYADMHGSTEDVALHPSMRSAKDWIHGHFDEEITLESLADRAGVSTEHLVRLFKKFEGTTPIKYVWQYRVLRAVEMLRFTGLTITEIAYRCGFKTSFHFARLVKQQTGLQPTQIRRQSWEPPEL